MEYNRTTHTHTHVSDHIRVTMSLFFNDPLDLLPSERGRVGAAVWPVGWSCAPTKCGRARGRAIGKWNWLERESEYCRRMITSAMAIAEGDDKRQQVQR